MRARMTSITTLLLTGVLLLVIIGSANLNGQTAAARVDQAVAQTGQKLAAEWTLSGRVYEGELGVEPPGSQPLEGVTVSVYGANNSYPDPGTFIRSTTTNADGWYGLTISDNDGYWEYYHIKETNPAGYTSVGATSVDGAVRTDDWIEYVIPLEGKTLTGNKFWDRGPATTTHTPTPTRTPTKTATPTGTVPPAHTATPTPTQTFGPEELPDLVITNVWNEDGLICYEIENIGDAEAAGGHYTVLFVDGDYTAESRVDPALPPGEQWGTCFDYEWECTPPDDSIVVVADYEDDVVEMDETNNHREDFWECATTPTSTPTPTPTPTSTRATDTPTPTPTPTTTLPPNCQDLLINGDFEAGTLPPWGSDGAVWLGAGRGSAYGAWLGGADNAGGELWQVVTIPAGANPVRLEFWWLAESEVEQPDDALEVLVQYGDEQADHLLTLRAVAPLGQWQQAAVDLTDYAGQTVSVTFFVHTDGEVPSTFRLDDVILWACGVATPTLTPTPTATPTGEAPQECVVNTTADHDDGECLPLDRGDCTLREAMRIANEHAGPDTILFGIPTEDPGYDPDTGKWTISPESDLPEILDDGTQIDGRAEVGHSELARPRALASGPACVGFGKITVNFISTTAGFVAKGANGKLAFLNIYGNQYGSAVSMYGTGAHHNTVECNVIKGLAWTAGIYHAWEGVTILNGAHDNTINANEIHSFSIGVRVGGISAPYNNILTANWIGSVGSGAQPNTSAGIILDGGAHHNTIGHTSDTSKGNVISGNDGPGIVIAASGTNNNVVANNRIGIQASTQAALPNKGAGVRLQQQAAANTIGPGNVIAYNSGDGVTFSSLGGWPGYNMVTWNSIYDNTLLGIRNSRLKPPVITSVSTTGVSGTTSPTCSGCVVEIFSNPSHTTAQPAEGKTPLGKATTQSDGSWQWAGSVPTSVWVTTTLTKSGDTSEFSSPKQAILTVTFIGKTCPPWQPIIICFPDIKVWLWAKIGGEWAEIDSTITDEEGQFTLADNVSEAPQAEYRLIMADPRYHVVGAESVSGGEVQDDGSILFTDLERGVYEENVFYVEEVESQGRVVNTTEDHDDGRCDPLEAGDCTLREAINAANEGEGPTTILFDIPDSDPGFADGQWIIRPETALPELTADGLTIGACIEPILVVMDGTLMPSCMNGFVLNGSQQKLLGLILSNWPANGVLITGANAYGNTVACNQIVDNVGDGVRIEAGAHDNTVGGSLGRNLISGNSGDGVGIMGTGTNDNEVIGNYIGTDEAGTAAWANSGHGVHILGGARYNGIGGESGEDGNVIAGNGHSGVMIEGSDTWSNEVGANLIGVALGGSSPLGNGHHGVGIYGGAMDNRVGSDYLQPNLIGGNGWSGVAIVNSDVNAVHGNYIGTDPSGVRKLGNGFHGVHVVGGIDNGIGSNTIAHNGSDGVRVEGATTIHNWITLNTITANGGKGIELVSGGNTELAPPVITSVTAGSVSGTACAGCTVEIFSDPADEGQYVHSPPTAVADSSGNWSWSGSISGAKVTATATDWFYNTSEFSTHGLLLFTGRVDFTPDSPFPRPIPVEVGLYGSQEANELGERLVSVPTSSDGAYELRYGGAVETGGEYAYFNLALVDPACEVESAESGSGGRVTEGLWIQFERRQFGGRAGGGVRYAAWPPSPFPDNDWVVHGVFELDDTPEANPFEEGSLHAPPSEAQPIDFYIDGIEVTQAIQCFDQTEGDTGQVCTKDNDLPLVAGKLAVVRVYATVNLSCAQVTSQGKIRVDLNYAQGLSAQGVGSYFTVYCGSKSDRREETYFPATANFYLTVPTAGTVSFWAEVNKDQSRFEGNYNNNRYPATGTLDIEFKARKALSIGYVMIDYHPKPSQLSYKKFAGSSKPSATWVASKDAYELAEAIYPLDTFNYYKFGSGWLYYSDIDVRDDHGSKLLAKLTKDWEYWKLSGKQMPDQFFGWLPDKANEDAGGWGGTADAPPPVYSGKGRAAIGVEGSNDLLPHEVGHNLKLYHAPCPAAGQPDAPSGIDPSWPYANGYVNEVPFRVAYGIPGYATDADIMSYCYPKWISPYHWKKLFNELAPSTTTSSATVSEPQPYVLVSGLVGDDDTGQLDPLVVVESNAALDTPAGGEYCLAFYHLSDDPLAAYCFDLSFVPPESAEPVGVAPFAYALPYPVETTRVALLHDETLLAERAASPSTPELSLESPGGGETWYDIHTVAWTAEDADGDDLTFAVFYSNDGGGTWTPVATDLTEPSYRLDTTSLPGGGEVLIRVLASDGFHTTIADSPSFSIPTKAPDVYVTTPSEGDLLPPEQALYLDGSAYDPEDGALSAAALSWWSDRDGLLGRGATVIVPGLTLSPGWHTLTLRAADSNEQIGSARINIFVGHRIYLPIILKNYS